jgi:type III secretory pathway lipoprotein EscJ
VPHDQVHKARMKLMAKDVPLRGAVGFELFNNADFGMTEFAQKVNYQRALQGEITRTILSMEDVAQARVHLAIPEQGSSARRWRSQGVDHAHAASPGARCVPSRSPASSAWCPPRFPTSPRTT